MTSDLTLAYSVPAPAISGACRIIRANIILETELSQLHQILVGWVAGSHGKFKWWGQVTTLGKLFQNQEVLKWTAVGENPTISVLIFSVVARSPSQECQSADLDETYNRKSDLSIEKMIDILFMVALTQRAAHQSSNFLLINKEL